MLQCIECDYLITEEERETSYYDYLCPKCNSARISDFQEIDLFAGDV